LDVTLVYVALCVPNGKLYFGITVESLARRIQRHECEARRRPRYKFHHALRKYGPSNFVWFEISRVSTWEDACDVERALIGYFDTTRKGYNTTEGGDGSWGRLHTDGSKKKLSISVSRTMTPEHRAELAALKRGNKASLKTRVRMSDAHVGQTKTPESRAKMSEAMTVYSPEFKVEAIAYANEHSFRAASRKYGLPPITIRRWTWSPEKVEEERLKKLARAKARDVAKRACLLDAFSSCTTPGEETPMRTQMQSRP
jgi:group I intron endonuclease